MSPGSAVFATVELWNEIWQYIDDPVTLIRSRRLNKTWKRQLDDTLKAHYDFDRFLTRYFPDKTTRIAFRTLMARYGVIISGSQALDFLGRFGFSAGSDTDIYVGVEGVTAVGDFFMAQGFAYSGSSWSDDVAKAADDSTVYAASDVIRVFKFTGPCAIDLVMVSDTPLSSILHFHFTIVMNGLTWDRAFSAYPAATFKFKRGLIMHGSDAALEKYRKRGFTLDAKFFGLAGSEFAGSLPTAARTFSSGDTWSMPFDTSDLQVSRGSPVLDAQCFSLSRLPYSPESGRLVISGIWMLAVAFSHCLLNRTYVLHPSCRRFAVQVLDYAALRWRARSGTRTWRVSMGFFPQKLHTWDDLMPFVVHTWIRGRPLFLYKGRSCRQFCP